MSLSYIFWPQEGLQGSREQAQKCLIGAHERWSRLGVYASLENVLINQNTGVLHIIQACSCVSMRP